MIADWRESRRVVKRLKAPGFEAEFEQSATPSTKASDAPAEAVPPTPELAPTNAVGDGENAGDKFIEGMALLRDGKYAEGMTVIRTTTAGRDPQLLVKTTALAQYVAFNAGVAEALEDLRKTYSDNPHVVHAGMYLADALSDCGRYDEALQILENEFKFAGNARDRTEITLRSANILDRTERGFEAKQLILRRLSEETDSSSRAKLASSGAKLLGGKSSAAKDHALALLELARQNSPNDNDLLFDTAHRASQYEAHGTAFAWYLRLVDRDPNHAAALNNLGVEADRLGISASAVRSYRRAEGLGLSLAMANIAQLLMDGGFLDDAAAVLDKARQQQDVDDHVLVATGRLGNLREEERSRNEETVKRASALAKWRLRYAEALLQHELSSSAVAGTYESGPGRHFVIEPFDGSVVTGTFQLTAEKSARYAGIIDGRLLLFDWKALQASNAAWDGSTTGRGIFIIEEGRKLSGVLLNADKVVDIDDFATSTSLVFWRVDRT